MVRVLEGRNRATPSEMASYVDEYEKMEKEKLDRKMAYMAECAKISGRQKALVDDAKGAGLNGKVLRATVKQRALERKAEAILEELEDDDAELLKDIREALGDYADLPLGKAAVASDDERTAAVVKAVKSDLSPKEQEDWDKAAPAGSA
jgi:uncharacterized protein (UPF0335 family)